MKKIAVISAILESPQATQKEFNDIISTYRDIIRGRMGLPFDELDMAVIAISVVADMDTINAFTGQLGKLAHVTVKTAISKKDV